MQKYSSRTSQSWLSWFLRGILILLFLILSGKLFEVQVIKGNYYRKLSEENRIRHVSIPASRGRILARNGEALADNVAIKKRVVASGNNTQLSQDLTNATPEEIITDYKRVYPLAEKFGHSSGYLGLVSEKEVGTVDPNCPEKGIRKSGSLVGVSGLEAFYDCLLRGTDGEQLIEVDTLGNKIRVLGVKNPISGQDLHTSVDFQLQSELSQYFKLPDPNNPSAPVNKKGGAVITDAQGRVIGFYSEPGFDPNLLIANLEKPIDGTNVTLNALFKNPDLPFFNRVTGGTFHPGSVYKPLVTLAALEEGVINKSYYYNDEGFITVNGFTHNNWYFTEFGGKEGQVDLTKALARSTDTFFYKIGELIGPNNIAKWSGTFGLNKKTNIDLPGEVEGLIPTPEWKKEVKKEPWYLGNTYNMAIGQGDVAVSPLEINTYIAAIAADGNLCEPSFNSALTPVCKKITLDQENIDLVKIGMEKACQTGGTGFTFFDFPDKNNNVKVACKTGTAEVGSDSIPHAWFTFFAPSENPEIVVTVLVEKGGQGSQIAGPIARKIADFYFQK